MAQRSNPRSGEEPHESGCLDRGNRWAVAQAQEEMSTMRTSHKHMLLGGLALMTETLMVLVQAAASPPTTTPRPHREERASTICPAELARSTP